MLAERVEEAALLLPDVVQVDLVEAEVGVLGQPGRVLPEVRRDEDDLRDVVRRDVLAGDVERLGGVEVPADRRREHVAAPLVVGDGEGPVRVGVAGQVHLQRELAAAAGVPVRADHLAELVVRLVHRDQAVGPLGAGAGRRHADRGADQGGLDLGQRPQPRPVDVDQPVVADLLAGQQRPDDVDALPQPRVAQLLARPALPGDVLVGRLAAAERDPEPAGEHRAERGDRLGDDRRVVALAGRVDRAERQRRRGQRRAEPREAERRLPLPGAPRREVVGAHRRGEAHLLGVLRGLPAAPWGGPARASCGTPMTGIRHAYPGMRRPATSVESSATRAGSVAMSR